MIGLFTVVGSYLTLLIGTILNSGNNSLNSTRITCRCGSRVQSQDYLAELSST
jgi:hypothetical protein